MIFYRPFYQCFRKHVRLLLTFSHCQNMPFLINLIVWRWKSGLKSTNNKKNHDTLLSSTLKVVLFNGFIKYIMFFSNYLYCVYLCTFVNKLMTFQSVSLLCGLTVLPLKKVDSLYYFNKITNCLIFFQDTVCLPNDMKYIVFKT